MDTSKNSPKALSKGKESTWKSVLPKIFIAVCVIAAIGFIETHAMSHYKFGHAKKQQHLKEELQMYDETIQTLENRLEELKEDLQRSEVKPVGVEEVEAIGAEPETTDDLIEEVEVNSTFFEASERYETIPKEIPLPSLNEPYTSGVGYCKHWRAGNRSEVLLHKLPQQSKPTKIYQFIRGIPSGYNAQSLYYCSAASRLGWESGTIKKMPTGPRETDFSKMNKEDVSLLCGGDNWGGWTFNSNRDLMKKYRISMLQRRSESPIDKTNKIDTFRAIRGAAHILGCDYVEQGFHSESYDFSNTKDCQRFFALGDDPNSDVRNVVWVRKSNGHKARGVRMTSFKEMQQKFGKCRVPHQFLTQRFMEKPLLLDGRKWDARVYVLVASLNPLIVYSFDLFHVRASLQKYANPIQALRENGGSIGKYRTKGQTNATVVNMGNALLTNAAVQLRKNPLLNYTEHMLDPWKIAKYTQEQGINGKLFTDKLFHKMQAVIEFVFHTIGRFPRTPGRFRIYGFDFMVDDSLKPVLIDLNRSPGLPGKSVFAKDLVKTLFEDATTLVHEIQAGKSLKEKRPPKSGHFHLTYVQDDIAKRHWEW